MAGDLIIWRNGKKEKWDLKRIKGNGLQTLSNAVRDKGKQSKKFLFYIKKDCSLSNDEFEERIDRMFIQNSTSFVEEMAVMKEDKVVMAFKKK